MPVSRHRAMLRQSVPVIPRVELRVPQARVLRALLPLYPADPPDEWPLLTRAQLGLTAGFTVLSGSCTRALNGIRAGSSSGPPQVGLLALGMVEVIVLDVEGLQEDNYRITLSGIAALSVYVMAGGTLPPLKDPSVCTNQRYQKEEQS